MTKQEKLEQKVRGRIDAVLDAVRTGEKPYKLASVRVVEHEAFEEDQPGFVEVKFSGIEDGFVFVDDRVLAALYTELEANDLTVGVTVDEPTVLYVLFDGIDFSK